MHILNFFFPRKCINCNKIGDYLCTSCKKLLISHPEICPYCKKFSPNYKTCYNCKTNKDNPLEGLIIAFSYKDLIKKLIIQLKYFHKKDISEFLTERLILAIETNEILMPLINKQKEKKTGTIKISYIPSHRFRHYCIKGYNQSKLLAQKISEKIGIPWIYIGKKKHRTPPQASLNKNQRLLNLNNAFQIDGKKIGESDTILIIDDVTTTGSTINELAKNIKNLFPKTKIRGIVLARNNK